MAPASLVSSSRLQRVPQEVLEFRLNLAEAWGKRSELVRSDRFHSLRRPVGHLVLARVRSGRMGPVLSRKGGKIIKKAKQCLKLIRPELATPYSCSCRLCHEHSVVVHFKCGATSAKPTALDVGDNGFQHGIAGGRFELPTSGL